MSEVKEEKAYTYKLCADWNDEAPCYDLYDEEGAFALTLDFEAMQKVIPELTSDVEGN